MRRGTLATLAASALLSGCVAAVVPVIAGGAIGKKGLAGHRARQSAVPAPGATATGLTFLPAGSMLPPPSRAPATGLAPGAVVPAPSVAADEWRALVRYVAKRMNDAPVDAVSVPDDGKAKACGTRPEAVLLNADLAGSGIVTRDVAVTALNAVRTMGAAIVFVADTLAGDAPAPHDAIAQAGFGTVERGRTLFATNDPAIARDYCVIAIGGARASDFPGTSPGVAWPWGEGWFLLGSDGGEAGGTVIAGDPK